jgi:type II secretory pathway pseudopilin PulG
MVLNPYLRRKQAHSQQQGYVLIVMLLFFVLLAISLTAAAPAMMQRIRREREIELIHRGKQYARAIRIYYRKFGRYPVRLEDLEKANNLRFLRRRYKDPMTPGGEWRLIHYGEAQLNLPNNPLLPGATGPGAGAGASPGVAGAGASSSFANTFSMSSPSASGQINATQGTGTSGQAGGAASSTESSQSGQSGGQSGQPGQPGTPISQLSSPLGSGPQFGGGPIVGVASTSKKESIKQLNQKNHYNDWEFVYDPRLDLNAAQAVQQMPGVGNQPNQISPGVQVSPGLQPGLTSPGMPGIQQPGSTR